MLWVVGIPYPFHSVGSEIMIGRQLSLQLRCQLIYLLFTDYSICPFSKCPRLSLQALIPLKRIVLPLFGSWEIHSFKSSSNVTSSVKASLIAILPLSPPSLLCDPKAHCANPTSHSSGCRILECSYICLLLSSTAISYLAVNVGLDKLEGTL